VDEDTVDIELLQWLRAQLLGANLAILAISQGGVVHTRLSALTAGANDHVAWPFAMDHLLSRIQNLFNRRALLPSFPPQGFARRVLVVDDSPTYGNALLTELQIDGHDVVLAENGVDALLFLERHRVDVVVLDIFLPDINGIEVCRRIKASPKTANLPVLMLTGQEKSVVRADAIAVGADEFVVKSRDLEAIRNKLRTLLVRNSTETNALERACDVSRDAAFLSGSGTSNRMASSGRAAESKRRTISSPGLRAAESKRRTISSTGMPAVVESPFESLSRGIASNRSELEAPEPNRLIQGTELFGLIVRGTGLSELLARSTVESVCRRLAIVPSELEPKDMPRIIEGLERTLQLFLPPVEAKERLRALSALGK
jgi:DNA-binding response OmpR family regulator